MSRSPATSIASDRILATLADAGVGPGAVLAVVPVPGVGLGLATATTSWAVATDDAGTAVAAIESQLRPRWLWWSAYTAATPLLHRGVRPAACWDLAAIHRLLHGGWQDEPALIWALSQGLDPARQPVAGQLDLLADLGRMSGGSGPIEAAGPNADHVSDDEGDPEWPVRPDGYLRPGAGDAAWLTSPSRAGAWAALAAAVQVAQVEELLGGLIGEPRPAGPDPAPADRRTTARSESAAALLCVELEADGLPVDRGEATRIITEIVGPAPADEAARERSRRLRDAAVLAHAPDRHADLRNPAQVRELLARIGIDVPDTRSWRLEPFAAAHPLVPALLAWRKAERIETTYGHGWLQRDVGADGRLRGRWHASDGAAGRMTAQAGLHNLPAELRSAVVADPGHLLVRADLGQIEPRVLAAVSGDPRLSAATGDADLYLPVARQLGVERPVAKIAVLAAMYGQTSGAAGQALRRMEQTYPMALGYLRAAEAAGRAGRPVTTYGGRLVPVWSLPEEVAADEISGPDRARHAAEAARGRFTRNAVIQGAAAELFKAWAATVRLALRETGGRIVLCLHDELVLHVPEATAPNVTILLHQTLESTAARWFPGSPVRFVADVITVQRWSQAKG